MSGKATERADVCVVGTGAGGGVVAKELAEAGAKVIMLERGGPSARLEPHEPVVDGAVRIFSASRALRTEVAWGVPPMPIIFGRCVGGSAALNAGTCFRLPERITEKWVTRHRLEVFQSAYLEKLYVHVETFVNIHEIEPELIGGHGRVFRRGIEALGWSGGPVHRNARGCQGAGACVVGCPHDAKLSPNLSWVPRAIEKGARLLTRCRVQRVVMERGRAVAVEAKWHANGGTGPAQALRVEAPLVVLAGGALGTPEILWSSGLGGSSGELGRNLRLHPGVVAGGLFDEQLDGWRGAPQSYFSDQFMDEGVILLVGSVPPPLGCLLVPGFGETHKQWMSRYSGFSDAGALISDSATGRLLRGPGGRPILTYRLVEEDARRLHRALERLCRVYLAAGAKVVFPGFIGATPARNERELGEVLTRFGPSLPRRRLVGGSLHPMGTCTMGVSPESSVVDPFGRVHGVEGVYVADGSILPTSTVVNPQETIMTLATHIAWGIRDGAHA